MAGYASAMEMRDLVSQLVREELARQAPAPTYATVHTIDTGSRSCLIVFPGEVTPVKATYGSVEPNAPGQLVRVEGPPGQRYIADVLGDTKTQSTLSGVPALLSSVSADLDVLETRTDYIQHIARNQSVMSGPCFNAVSTANVKWGSTIYFISSGRTPALQSAAWYEVAMPTSGTITGVGGADNKTVHATNGIPLPDWESLWYILPTGNAAATFVPANLRAVKYTADIDMDDNWVLICFRSGTADKQIHWANGMVSIPWRKDTSGSTGLLKTPSGTVNFGSGFQDLWYRRVGEMVEYQYKASWGSGRSTPPNDWYIDLPIGNAAERSPGSSDDGYGRFYSTNDLQWEFAIKPQINPGANRVHLLCSTSNAGVALKRMRNADGGGGAGTGVPFIAGSYIDGIGSILTWYIKFPHTTQPA